VGDRFLAMVTGRVGIEQFPEAQVAADVAMWYPASSTDRPDQGHILPFDGVIGKNVWQVRTAFSVLARTIRPAVFLSIDAPGRSGKGLLVYELIFCRGTRRRRLISVPE